jgi:dihydrolipoamide dehydrogenase
VVDSTGALCFDRVPPRLGVIGAGVIGLELGSVWNRLGSEVVIVEALDEFLGLADHQITRVAGRQFKKQGLDIRLGAMVQSIESTPSGLNVAYTQKDQVQTLEVDRIIVAVGRRPATVGLLSPDSGVSLDARGFIEVDDKCRTGVDNIWAVGDAVRGPMLAHKSSEEGVAVAERIAGGAGHVDFNTVPWVIYTSPEIAWVGQTENALKAQGIPIRTGSFPFAATGRALAMEEPVGLVKMIAHEHTDRLLGVHMVGPHVSELIAECVLAMEYQASSEDLARTIHAHPTLSEAVHEAALAVDKRAIHKAN